MADVFISYKSERRAAAEHVARILELNGYTVWFDYGLMSGRDFSRQIERELRAAKAVMVLWCNLSRESDWVNNEALLAKRLGKYLPVWIDKVDLPLDFIRDDTLDLTGWDGAPRSHMLDRLFDQIEKLSGKPQAPLMGGLRDFEGTWRRYGSPRLLDFPLAGLPLRKEDIHLPPAPEPVVDSPSGAEGERAHSPGPPEPEPEIAVLAPREPPAGRAATVVNLAFVALVAIGAAMLATYYLLQPPTRLDAVFGPAQERLHKSFIALAVDDHNPLRFGMNALAVAPEIASDDAMRACRLAGGTDCRLVTAISQGCLAFAATGAGAKVSGFASAATLDYTRLAAENVCKAKANGDGCRVLGAACW